MHGSTPYGDTASIDGADASVTYVITETVLPRHRKTLKLQRLLGVQLAHAVGLLELLWMWTLDGGPEDGGPLTDDELQAATGWSRDVAELRSALVEAGFLEDRSDGLYVHDWLEHSGRVHEKRRTARERMQRSRASRSRNDDANEGERSANVPSTFATQAKPSQTNSSQPEINSTQEDLLSARQAARSDDSASSSNRIDEVLEVFRIERVELPSRPFVQEWLDAGLSKQGFIRAAHERARRRLAEPIHDPDAWYAPKLDEIWISETGDTRGRLAG